MRNYNFDGSISLDVLKNYLNRAMTYSITPYGFEGGVPMESEETENEFLRAITNVGAKYICRSAGEWNVDDKVVKNYPVLANFIEKAHKADPDIVFEACIFETCGPDSEKRKIPAHVFEAFGLPFEDRGFCHEKMAFADGKYRNQWCENKHAPDVTNLETQMYYYYLATTYIDLGFEGLHMGQATMTGRDDTDFRCWEKLLKMIRAYAKEHARRHYVIINAHVPTYSWMTPEGVSLGDFCASPIRIEWADEEEDHAASEDNPQRCEIKFNYCASPYKSNGGGISPSGWKTDKYPYLVEFDNWGGRTGDNTKRWNRFGYDEISWFANQPDWYRRQWLEETTLLIDSFEENGFVAMPGRRCAYSQRHGKMVNYVMNSSKTFGDSWDDEETIKKIFERN